MGSDFLGISALAGLLGLDATAVFQGMLSRPLVAGALFGLLLGDWQVGVLAGGLLEMLSEAVIPVGAFVPPDFQVATAFTVAGSVALLKCPALAAEGVPVEGVVALMTILSIPLAVAGGALETQVRRLDVVVTHWVDRRVAAGSPGAVSLVPAATLPGFFLKTALLSWASLELAVPLLSGALGLLPAWTWTSLSLVYGLMLMLGLAILADLFWEKRAWVFLAAGFGVARLMSDVLHLPGAWIFAALAAMGLCVPWWLERRGRS